MRRTPAGAPPGPPRKRFGQHFLHDPQVCARIVAALAPQPGDHLVEIGPGRGALTHLLLGRPDCTVDAIEIDRDLAAHLRAAFAAYPAAHLHGADALRFDFAALARERGGPLRLIGNLPYNISTPLLFHLLSQRGALTDLHVMLQREVVDRLAAAPGSADYGRLTVMLAPWFTVERLFDVGPGAFQPPPKVWSAVARLAPRRQPLFTPAPRFAELVARAFSQRRKTLRRALAGLADATALHDSGIDPTARPGTVSPQQYNTLAQTLDRAGR
ncbi:MAG: 16S rRNA (adenine(1518)-N(6)/adenine(1519)-N(6))-dimethyltransferase RsmA [Proteobacteria bacterium]|nr:16S rRNA (adenine(1518)-N(6)/adenine(1519)-N(6))-dimethyltransferase RsmA [Pseudomonadota bacterium]